MLGIFNQLSRLIGNITNGKHGTCIAVITIKDSGNIDI